MQYFLFAGKPQLNSDFHFFSGLENIKMFPFTVPILENASAESFKCERKCFKACLTPCLSARGLGSILGMNNLDSGFRF